MNQTKITPVHIVIEALNEIVVHSKSLSLYLITPIILLVLFTTYQINLFELVGLGLRGDNLDVNRFLYMKLISYIIISLISAIVAVSTHRIIILGNNSLPNKLGLYFSVRELKFIWWAIICYFPSFIVMILCQFLFTDLVNLYPQSDIEITIKYFDILKTMIVGFVAVICLTFLGLILPGIAIENGFNFRKTLSLTKGLRTPIFFTILISVVIIFVLSNLISLFVNYFNLWEYSLIKLIVFSVYSIFAVFEVVVLSVIYKKLC